MSKWKKVKLGDIATYINGCAFKPSDWSNQGVPIVRIQNLTGSFSETNYYDKHYNSKYEINNGDVLISWSASLGVYVWDKGRAILNQHIFKVVFNKIDIDKTYFIFAVKSLLEKMEKQTHGATMKHITKPLFDNMEFPFPPMEEQKKIAARLDAVSDLLAKQKQLLSEQDNLIQSFFYDMFGDLERNSKFPIKELADVCHLITDGVHKKPIYTENGIPFISVKDITTGNLCFDDCKFISIKDHNDYCSRCFPEYNDILYTKVGATYGKAAIVNTHKEFSLYVSVALLKPKKEIINSIFLKTMMNTTFIKKQADKSIKGIGVPDLHLVEIKKFKVTVPPLELQEKFAAIVKQIESEKSKIKSAIAETQTLFNALMSEYFEE